MRECPHGPEFPLKSSRGGPIRVLRAQHAFCSSRPFPSTGPSLAELCLIPTACGDAAATRAGSCRSRRPVHFPLPPLRTPAPSGVRGGQGSGRKTVINSGSAFEGRSAVLFLRDSLKRQQRGCRGILFSVSCFIPPPGPCPRRASAVGGKAALRMKTATIGGQNARRRKGTAPAGLEIPHPYDKPIEQFPLKDNLVEIQNNSAYGRRME